MAQNLTYTRCGDYLIPDIQLSHTSDKLLGKYGRMRRAFLAENNPMLYNDMVLTETLFPHLWEIDETARRRVEQIMTELLERNSSPDKSTQLLSFLVRNGTEMIRCNITDVEAVAVFIVEYIFHHLI